MHFTSETTADGVSERLFILGDIRGVLWAPAGHAVARPLVLLGHGGGQHKKSPGVVARARRYVTACGFVAAAIDAPGHGDRPRTEQDERHAADLRQRMAAGEPITAQVARDNAERSVRAVPEWRATLDALQAMGQASGSVGYWGGGELRALLPPAPRPGVTPPVRKAGREDRPGRPARKAAQPSGTSTATSGFG